MMTTTFTLAALLALLCAADLTSGHSVGESCTDAPNACDAPLSCVGNPGNKKCFMKKPLGMECGIDPYWVCENGLICAGGKCRKRLGRAERCGTPETACDPPLSCVGNQGNRKCFMKMGLGMKCGKEPFWVCENSLSCIRGICKRSINVAGSCGIPNTVCKAPLSCVGLPSNKKCFMKKGLNMPCGKDPFWVCQNGLVCADGVCKRPVGSAAACNDPDTACVPPFFCVGNPGKKKCFKKMFRGMRCGKEPFWVCADHLDCVDGICKKRMSERGICNVNLQICKEPLSCVGTPELKRCVMKKGLDMVCGIDPYWVCEDDLVCVDRRCKLP